MVVHKIKRTWKAHSKLLNMHFLDYFDRCEVQCLVFILCAPCFTTYNLIRGTVSKWSRNVLKVLPWISGWMSCTLNAQHGGTAGLKLQKHQTEAKFRTAGAAATRLKRILQQQRSQNKQNRCAFSGGPARWWLRHRKDEAGSQERKAHELGYCCCRPTSLDRVYTEQKNK